MRKTSAEYAIDSRKFVSMQRFAALSTISVSREGYPFGSIVPYDITENGEVVIFISLIAEHYKNLTADPRASLLVIDQFGWDNPQAHARATLLAKFRQLEGAPAEQARQCYESRFPDSINHEISHNFVFMQGEPQKIRWIGGFGDITWVDGKTFGEIKVSAAIYHGLEIIAHMNDDHRQALVDLAHAFSDFKPDLSQVQMVDLDTDKFTLALKTAQGYQNLNLNFPEPVQSPEQARNGLIKLLKQAREKLLK